MALYVSGHFPTINQQGVTRNPVVKVYFNKELHTSSVNYRTISMHDELYSTVPGTASWDYTQKGTPSGIANILTFTPSIYLASETEYSVYIAKQPDSVISLDDEQLTDFYKFSFVTGSGTTEYTDPSVTEQLEIDLQHAIDEENYTEAAGIQDLIDQYDAGSLSGSLPEAEVVDPLNVNSTYPINEQTNVSDMAFIEIEFNDTLASSGVAVGDYITVTKQNVLD